MFSKNLNCNLAGLVLVAGADVSQYMFSKNLNCNMYIHFNMNYDEEFCLNICFQRTLTVTPHRMEQSFRNHQEVSIYVFKEP